VASDGPSCIATLFGLAPCGVLPATDVTAGAVRSYRTFSPLPLDATLARLARGGIFSVPLVRQVALPGSYPAHCPSELGLSSRPRPSGYGEQTHRNPGTKTGDRLNDYDTLIITYRSRFRVLSSEFVFRVRVLSSQGYFEPTVSTPAHEHRTQNVERGTEPEHERGTENPEA